MSRKFHRQMKSRSTYVERGVSSLGRGRHSFSRRRRFPWKTVGLIVLLLCLVGGGVLTARFLGGSSLPIAEKKPTETTAVTTTATATTTAATTKPKEAKPTAGAPDHVRAFFMTADTLRDTAARSKQLKEAVAAGWNGVVFDLKDADGNVLYASQTSGAKKVGAVTSDALTAESLRSFLDECETQGVLCMPRLYCFSDRAAAIKLPSARILLAEDPALMWLDDSAARHGKPWLNPYSTDAHAYLKAYITELSEMGFTALMLDGVQFPEQLYAASFGHTKLTSLGKAEVLARFVGDMKKAVPKTALVVCASGTAVMGEQTAVYGGNPLGFGATYIAPQLFPSRFGNKLTVGKDTLKSPAKNPGKAVEMAFKQVGRRVELLTANERPAAVIPWVEADGYSDAQVAAQIKAVGGTDAPCIVYSAAGTYHFDRYTDNKEDKT